MTTTLTAAPVVFDRNPRAILVEADIAGGPDSTPRDAHVSLFRLYGDGLVIWAGDPAPLATGLDATVKFGYLSDAEIQDLLAFLSSGGFAGLAPYYEPRPAPKDMPTARVSYYGSKEKTVRVYAPDSAATPQSFADTFERIVKSVPAAAQVWTPTDGYLSATPAGSASDLRTSADLIEWTSGLGVHLVDAPNGATVSGGPFSAVAELVSRAGPRTLYKEGAVVYRVRFAPNMPRAPHMTDRIGPILAAPREFEGRSFDLVGYFRGWNLMSNAPGNPAKRNDWVLEDGTGAVYVTGVSPQGLDPSSRSDLWSVVRVRAVVVYVRLGTSHLEAKSVEVASMDLNPTPVLFATPEAAILAVKSRYPEMNKIKAATPGAIGTTSDIRILERSDGWDIVFFEGWGDCPSGCLNYRYTYYSAKKDGRLVKAGEFSRLYNSSGNSFETSGTVLWGVPK